MYIVYQTIRLNTDITKFHDLQSDIKHTPFD